MVESIEETNNDGVLHGRVRREMKTVQAMISLYCRAHHQTNSSLCGECERLNNYALKRLSGCPFQGNKTTCSKCDVHCYNNEMKQRIVEVMRFSGPRMLLHHPLLAIAHLLDEKKPALSRLEKNVSTPQGNKNK